MSTTPRTDAAEFIVHGYPASRVVPSQDARQLETELNEARAQIAKLSEDVLTWAESSDRNAEKAFGLEQQLSDALAQVERLREFVANVALQHPQPDAYWVPCRQCCANKSCARELIAALYAAPAKQEATP